MAVVPLLISAIMMLGYLTSFVCGIIILVHAFQEDVGQGFLCLCVPCYILYYMFARFEHTHKVLIIVGYFMGGFLGWLVAFVAAVVLGSAPGIPGL